MKTKSTIKILLILALTFIGAARIVSASETNGTITSGGNNGYAWSNQAGWVNFAATNGNINITDSGIVGYAWNANYGWINMSPTNGGVTVAANGALSGYAWGSGLGWIDFSGVSINSSGKFTGTASGANIGTLTFDCANCSVVTDYRPSNFRTATPIQTPPSSGGGGGGGGGIGLPMVPGTSGQIVPAHIDVFNAPMRIFPAQSGTLTQNLINQKRVTLDAPNNVYSDEISFIIKEEAVSQTIVPTITVISNALFDVTAWDKAGNQVRSFLKPVKIMISVPELSRVAPERGVYFFDEATEMWIKMPAAVFTGDAVSFYVSHLTLFAIFSAAELPSVMESPFPLSAELRLPAEQTEIQPPQEELEKEAEITARPSPPARQAEVQPPQKEAEIPPEETPPVLFDIEARPAPGELQTSMALIVTVIIGAIILILLYLFGRKYAEQQTDDWKI